jgi:hypothetical protein
MKRGAHNVKCHSLCIVQRRRDRGSPFTTAGADDREGAEAEANLLRSSWRAGVLAPSLLTFGATRLLLHLPLWTKCT